MRSVISINDVSSKEWLKQVTFGKNSTLDVFLILLGGLPIYIGVLMMIGEKQLLKDIPFSWPFWANQVVSMPHVFATLFRLSRKIHEGKVNPLYGFPAFVATVTALVAATIYGFFVPAMTAVNVWQSYHYLRQTYGVSRFFAKPAGETEQEKRLSFWAYHAAMPLFILGRWNMLFIYWHGKPSDAIIPVSFPSPLLDALWVLAGAGLMIGLYTEIIKYKRMHGTFDCSGLVNLLTYYVMHYFGFLSMTYYMTGFIAVTIFHAVQYLGITWRLEHRQVSTKFILSDALKFCPQIISFVLFCGAAYLIGDTMQGRVFPMGNVFMPQLALICMSSISAHHYLVDTVLWNRKAGI